MVCHPLCILISLIWIWPSPMILVYWHSSKQKSSFSLPTLISNSLFVCHWLICSVMAQGKKGLIIEFSLDAREDIEKKTLISPYMSNFPQVPMAPTLPVLLNRGGPILPPLSLDDNLGIILLFQGLLSAQDTWEKSVDFSTMLLIPHKHQKLLPKRSIVGASAKVGLSPFPCQLLMHL